MPIQWFPGHMNSTRKAIAERVPEIDVVIELLDARFPGSSENPLLAELTAGRPSLKVLNKQDLADAVCTNDWLAHFGARAGTRAIALDAGSAAPARQLVTACRALAPLRGGLVKPLRILICGIPNVGKSTLINTLVGHRSAKTGDEPGITKTEQRIVLDNDVYLFDTPGMLWPRIACEESGANLAAGGSIGRNAYDEEEVALTLLARAREGYGDRLMARYRLDTLERLTETELLTEIGRRRGALLQGGLVSLQKAAEVAINDFRSGAWGRMTLEAPEQFAQWQAQATQRDAERLARRAARKQRGGGLNATGGDG